MRVPAVLAMLALAACVQPRSRPLAPEQPHADSLRLELSRLQELLRARDDTIRSLRLELQLLKEIDLKPRRPRGVDGTGANDR